jgi:DNA-binding response OmpR family regulator
MAGLRGARILVIEDNDGIAELLRLCLSDEDALSFRAKDGADALQLLEEGLRPDVLLLDLGLPDMDGGEFITRIRAEGFQMPALLVSGWPEVAARAEDLGLPFLRKPFDLDELAAVLKELVDKRPAARPAGA